MVRVPRATVVTAGLVVAVVVLVGLAATGDRVPLATEGDRSPAAVPARPTEQPNGDETETVDRSPSRDADVDLPGAGVIAVLVQTAILVLVMLALVSTSRSLFERSRRLHDPPDHMLEEHWPAPGTELVAAVGDGLAAMRAGRVDDAVIACWVRLEDAAATAGAGRELSDTPAELAARLLAELQAPPDAVDRLLRRYRQARYSHHPLNEADRAVAIEALEEIRTAIAGARA